MSTRLSRRRFLAASAALAVSRPRRCFSIVAPARPTFPSGLASGDVTPTSAVLWSRADRPARLLGEYATVESFADSRKVAGPDAVPDSGLTARIDLAGLPPGQRVFYRLRFQDLSDSSLLSEPFTGSFQTPAIEPRDVRFVWSGDVCGQGWGINADFGGMKCFETMRRLRPDFFLHSGDTIYADNPLKSEVRLDDGTVWKNLVTPEKSKVAETLDEFRGNYAYNLFDENVRRFNAEVPSLVQWDDHEVKNNWYPGQLLDDPLYTVKDASLLAARSRRALLEYFPIRPSPEDPQRIYRAYSHGPLLELFMLDQRSYRGPNTRNRQTTLDKAAEFLGPAQLEWVKKRLAGSKAVWKVIASDMPLGYVVRDRENSESYANGENGLPLGRELELAHLLQFIRTQRIRNVVFLTADVHHAAAIHYDPARAAFKEFDPFWEFISGPLHAGTFGPPPLDKTFGPESVWNSYPRGTKGNRPPSAGLQFFGMVSIDAKSKGLRVEQYNVGGERIYAKELTPRA